MPGKHVPISFGSTKVKPPLIQPGQRIGIMGGSFNPPHDGHGLISRTALRRLGLDQLWWVVTPGNPLKINNGLPPASERMELCRRLANDSRMRVTAFEEDLRTPYTAATMAFLARRSVLLDYGGGQSRLVPPLAALARYCLAGADRRGRPAGLASQGSCFSGSAMDAPLFRTRSLCCVTGQEATQASLDFPYWPVVQVVVDRHPQCPPPRAR